MTPRALFAAALIFAVAGCRRSQPLPPAQQEAAPPPPVVVPAIASVSVAPPPAPAPMPTVEELAVKKCPARIARVKLPSGSRVELIGCPESEGYEEKIAGAKSALVLVDSENKTEDSVELSKDEETAKLEVEDVYGDGRPMIVVTTTHPCMGSWCGPTTRLYDVESGKLRAMRIDGDVIELKSALKITWWFHPARSGKGKDIYKIVSTIQGTVEGTRYAFENAKWVAHKGPLKNWTGEHLKDTEAEFP
jgi:hypothetical protein